MLYVVSFPDSQYGTEGLTEGLGMRPHITCTCIIHYKIIVMDFASVFCITVVGISHGTHFLQTFSSSCSIMVECSLVPRPPFNPLEGGLGTRLDRMLMKISVATSF